MKKLLPLALLLATFALVHTSPAQASFSDSSGIRRPTPTPGPVASNSKKPFEASLSANEKGQSSAKSMLSFLSSTKKIYVNFEDDMAAKGDKLQVTWVALDAKPYPKNKQVTSNSSVMPGPGTVGSYYLPADHLPTGRYVARLSVNGKPVKSLDFSVTK